TLASGAKTALTEFLSVNGYLPNGGSAGSNQNSIMGLPEPDKITGQAVNSIKVQGPSIIIEYNQKVGEFLGGVSGQAPTMGAGLLSLTLTNLKTVPGGQIDDGHGSYVWLCGYADPMASRLGYTTVDRQYLPSSCRG
ncbi:MAG: pilin, partial [Neisseriaceae bacterium]|nr:pilin [Neisseriaceae bacterium]